MSKALSIITSSAVPLPVENIDTDQIIPARFLKATTRAGFGKNLFRDWRFEQDDENRPITDFVLNKNQFRGSILVAGKNFGCGSSREHAAWAIKDYGFDAVISSFFADIFRNNALNNFLLPVQVTEEQLQQILSAIFTNPSTELTINVEKQTLQVGSILPVISFDINPYKKECLLNGFDDIEYLINTIPEIEAYEKAINEQ